MDNNPIKNYTPLDFDRLFNESPTPFRLPPLKLPTLPNIKDTMILFMAAATVFLTYRSYGVMREVSLKLDRPAQPVVQVLSAQDTRIEKDIMATGLQFAVKDALMGTSGTYAVAVKNLKTGESYYLNEHRKFQPASVYKLWIMGTVFDQIQKGKLREYDMLQQSVETLNARFGISSEYAEKTNGTIRSSVKDALEEMITRSDNYTAYLLTDRVTLATVSSYLASHNLNESRLGVPPITTAADVALFLEKLYNGDLANKQYSQKMTDILKRQKLNTALPKYLPRNLDVAHKTGELDLFANDAGIVYSDKGDYIIVVLSETQDRKAANERIAQISRSVHSYFDQ